MNHCFRFGVLLTAVMSWILPATGQTGGTYYVAIDGDDVSGAGTIAAPWATITHALDSVPDDSLVLVRPGSYFGRQRLRGVFAVGVTVRSEIPYAAQLRNNAQAVTSYTGIGITLEGFDIAHDGPGASGLVIQIQDLRGDPGGADATSRIVLRDNIIHDSYNNDLLKINYGARDITVEGNLFFNQQGSDEHIDINGVENVVIIHNIFYNDFAWSGRVNQNDTSSFVVVKNSAELPVNRLVTIDGNVFLNWEGSTGSNFVLTGEDGKSLFEAQDVVIQNNLMLGNANNVMRAPSGVKGCRDITFRNNTVSGDLPAMAFAMRLNQEGANPPNENIVMVNNIWVDPFGSMGADGLGSGNDFSDTPIGETTSFLLDHNLYWNGANPIPENPSDLVNVSDDVHGVIADPLLVDPSGMTLPRWDGDADAFISGSTTIRQEFERIVNAFATLGGGSQAIDAADPLQAPEQDILGTPRGTAPDAGAWEMPSCTGDFDGDGDVDTGDLAALLHRWLTPSGAPYDQDGDGYISVCDGILLVNSFGPCAP